MQIVINVYTDHLMIGWLDSDDRFNCDRYADWCGLLMDHGKRIRRADQIQIKFVKRG